MEKENLIVRSLALDFSLRSHKSQIYSDSFKLVDRELYSSNPFATNHALSKATLIVALGTPLRLLWYPKILPRFDFVHNRVPKMSQSFRFYFCGNIFQWLLQADRPQI